MKQTLIRTAIALGLVATLSGCATTAAFGTIGAAQEANRNTGKAVVKGAGVGCAVGVGIALLTGSRDQLGKACATGAVVGGVTAGIKEYRAQLNEARALQEEAQAMGVRATVNTRVVEIENRDGTVERTEALDALRLDLNAQDLARAGANTQRLVDRATRMTEASVTPITITVIGQPMQRAWVVQRIEAGLKPDTKTTIKEVSGQQPALVLSPVPDVN